MFAGHTGCSQSLRPLVSVSYQHLLLIFSPPPFASGCICSTKYRLSFHIHYYFPRRWGWALWCVRFRDLSRYVLSRLRDGRSGRWSRAGLLGDGFVCVCVCMCVCVCAFSSCFLATQQSLVLLLVISSLLPPPLLFFVWKKFLSLYR